MTNDELAAKYKAIYKQKTGNDLSDDEALDQALKLVALVGAIYDPLPKRKPSIPKNEARIEEES
jgi:hypothetical protein